MKSILVFFVAILLLMVSTFSLAISSGNQEGRGLAISKGPSAPLILADTELNPEDSNLDPSNEDDGNGTGGSSSETGGSSTEMGGRSSNTGGSDSETGGRSSDTGGQGSEDADDENNSGNGNYYIQQPAW